MKYRRRMNGEDYLIFEGCYPMALCILGVLALAGGVVWVMVKVL